jgi:ABC-type branched-subunit amino acid transport system ATPase component
MTALALELKDVRKSFGRSEIIRGANLQVPKGERFAIIGPNGAGKSTLFNLISGRFPVSSTGCRCTKTCAARCCGRSATSIRSGIG